MQENQITTYIPDLGPTAFRSEKTEAEYIEKLLHMLAKHTLDPAFEERGNFVETVGETLFYEGPLRAPKTGIDLMGAVHIYGNFHDCSWVFNLYTRNLKLVKKLEAAIRRNQLSPNYAKAKESVRIFNAFWQVASARHRKLLFSDGPPATSC